MPAPEEIHESLRQISNDWRSLAIFWHIYFGVLAVALVFVSRPTRKIVGLLLSLPLICVSVMAWRYSNPFNGTFFALVTFTLLVLAMRFGSERCQLSTSWWARMIGAALSVFGWIYPHFLNTSSFLPYLYAAPLGLVPCPTLSMVIGISMMLGARDESTDLRSGTGGLALSIALPPLMSVSVL